MRLLVCGDRRWDQRQFLYETLDEYEGVEVVIEGEAAGADSMARDWATSRGIPVRAFPAQWDAHGRAAGHIRNAQMLREGKPDIVVAFHNDIERSKGTKHMVAIARKAGIPVVVFNYMMAIFSDDDGGG